MEVEVLSIKAKGSPVFWRVFFIWLDDLEVVARVFKTAV